MYNSGCILTEFDGTEHIATVPNDFELPEEYSYRKYLPKVLNQGRYPICVPCSLSTYINWFINMNTGEVKDNHVNYFDIYNSKEIEGEGMTFKEAFNYLRKHGVETDDNIITIDEYARVTNFMALDYAIFANGPCVGVLPVTIADGTTDFWNRSYGSVMGFHAIAIVGYTSDGYIIRNSWGDDYGIDGYALISKKDASSFKEIWTMI